MDDTKSTKKMGYIRSVVKEIVEDLGLSAHHGVFQRCSMLNQVVFIAVLCILGDGEIYKLG